MSDGRDGVEFDADFDSGRGGFAVRIEGQLLPVRFVLECEAFDHFRALRHLRFAKSKRAAA